MLLGFSCSGGITPDKIKLMLLSDIKTSFLDFTCINFVSNIHSGFTSVV